MSVSFDIINITDLGEYQNPNSFISIDFQIDMNGDLVINSDGSLANVSGTLKLIQDIRLFLLSPTRTSIIDSSWGNPAIEDIGRAPMNYASLETIIEGAVYSLKNFKDNEQVLRGFPLEGTELISSIDSVKVTKTGNNSFIAVIALTDGEHNQQTVNLDLEV